MNGLKTLRPGSTGPQVELLQLALTRAGFPVATDGIFGDATLAALTSFQSRHMLVPDGIAGSRTWNALTPYLTGYLNHTIRSGDTLFRLSVDYNTTIAAIETANPGADPLALRVGARIIIPLGFHVVPDNITFTSTALSFCIRGLTARYPFLSAGTVGTSVMCRNISYLSIGKGSNHVFYNAAHHANEWITTPLILRFIEEYAYAYSIDGMIHGTRARALSDLTTLFAVPMVNPDGVDLATGELASGRFYEEARQLAENYPSIPFPSGWKANINGIDTNLQYPAGWENARTIKFEQGFTVPGPRDYVGPAPLTAPESRAIYDFTRSNRFTLTLSYHTQGEVIYWKYLNYEPINSREIAYKFGRESGYDVEETPFASGFAGYKDWFIEAFDRPGYTIEAGLGVSPLPLEQFPEIYARNIGILTLGLSVTL